MVNKISEHIFDPVIVFSLNSININLVTYDAYQKLFDTRLNQSCF